MGKPVSNWDCDVICISVGKSHGRQVGMYVSHSVSQSRKQASNYFQQNIRGDLTTVTLEACSDEPHDCSSDEGRFQE